MTKHWSEPTFRKIVFLWPILLLLFIYNTMASPELSIHYLTMWGAFSLCWGVIMHWYWVHEHKEKPEAHDR